MPLMGMAGSLAGGLFSGLFANAGAQANASALRYAAGLQNAQYQQNAATLQPFIGQGAGASNLLGNYLGVNGNPAQSGAMANYQNSPFFQMMLKTADTNTLNAAGAGGAGISGNALNALYGQNANLWQNQFNTTMGQLSGLAGQGVGAAGALAGSGTALAQSQGNLYGQSGAAQGAGMMALGNAGGGALNNAGIWGMLGGGNALSQYVNGGQPSAYNSSWPNTATIQTPGPGWLAGQS
jgi:hypothetical protein